MTGIETYRRGCELAVAGHSGAARELFEQLGEQTVSNERARSFNSLGVLAAESGDEPAAVALFQQALEIDPDCRAARQNLALCRGMDVLIDSPIPSERPTRIAILSFLFNWPSTGGGIIHTVELTQFIQRAGYEVRLIHPRYEPWGIGHVDGSCPVPTTVLPFATADWNVSRIQEQFRSAVDEFAPDHVLITDCWNFKPHLARAVEGHAYHLRMQALECVCPLNNLRLQPAGKGLRQCRSNQLAQAATCRECLSANGESSGNLHRAERALSGVGTAEYDAALHRALREAASVLVLNRSAASLLEPYASDVRVVTWGMDSARFPWPPPDEPALPGCGGLTTLLFAGLAAEPIKGFDVLHAACAQLWERRQDFRLVITADETPTEDQFLVAAGWQSQRELPRLYRATDITLVPTIAQEGLSRTAVEAMASGRPVIGSRLGGMPDLIADGITGLLAEPGSCADWVRQIEWLLDHPQERAQMGEAGRRRYERSFVWERVIEEQYVPLFGAPVRNASGDR